MLFNFIFIVFTVLLSAVFSLLSYPTYLLEGLQWFILFASKFLVLFSNILFLDVILKVLAAFVLFEGLIFTVVSIRETRRVATLKFDNWG